MARKNNRTCIVCGKVYTYCNHCAEDSLLPVWYAIYHNENCRNLFNIAAEYLSGETTKEEAKEKFDACDLTYKENLNHHIIKAINEVCEEKKVEKPIKIKPRTKKVVVEEKVENVESSDDKKMSEDVVVSEDVETSEEIVFEQ